jgi:hypothetical protein
MVDQKQLILQRVLEERPLAMPRPAHLVLEQLLADTALIERMEFCCNEERGRLRNSVQIACNDSGWSLLLNHEPASSSAAQVQSGPSRGGLEMTPAEVLKWLQTVPIWFLAIDPIFVSPILGAAPKMEQTVHRLAPLHNRGLRRLVLMDQIDAALDEQNRDRYDQLQRLLRESRS